MKTVVYVNNIRCGGCANSISKALLTVNGVFGADVNIAEGKVTVDHTDNVTKEQITEKLKSLGYPQKI